MIDIQAVEAEHRRLRTLSELEILEQMLRDYTVADENYSGMCYFEKQSYRDARMYATGFCYYLLNNFLIQENPQKPNSIHERIPCLIEAAEKINSGVTNNLWWFEPGNIKIRLECVKLAIEICKSKQP